MRDGVTNLLINMPEYNRIKLNVADVVNVIDAVNNINNETHQNHKVLLATSSKK